MICCFFTSACEHRGETYYTYNNVTIKRIDYNDLTHFYYVNPNNPQEDFGSVNFKHSGSGWFFAELVFFKDKSVEVVVSDGIFKENIKDSSLFRVRYSTFQDWSIDTIRHNVCCVCPCILPCPVETIPNREYDSKVLIECKGGCYTMGPFIKPFTRYADSIPIYNFRSSNKKKKIQSLIPSKKFIVNGISFEMVAVNGGNFTMGERRMFRKNTTHEVFLSNYYIGKTEVTQALWKAVMGTNPSSFKGDKFPVEKISWYDCQEFVKKLNQLTGENFRLPTEAEWEFAACGGNQSKGYKYSGSNKIDEVAWCSNLFYNQTLPVATKYPNELGIYDMSGNVWEWCYDYYGKVPSDSLFKFSLNMDSARVIRGGSWCEDAKLNRVTYRSRCEPNQAEYNIGLRLCLSE